MRDRLAAGFLLVLMALGCLVLWVGAPLGGLWLGAKLTSSFGPHLMISLVLAFVGMLGVAVVLVWINSLYLRVTGGEAREVQGIILRRQGPLEPMLLVCLVAGVAALLAWFFLFAENPNVNVY
jgi:hypothetical protein